MAQNTVTRYFHDIKSSKPLSREEEIELAKEIQTGSESALNKLITANLRFVVTIARQYQNRGLDLEDLIAEGNIGLIEAAKRFDPNAGYRFISYGVWYIRQAIQSAINANRLIRLPMNKICDSIAVNRAISKFQDKEGRRPSEAELSKECGISIQDVRTIIRINQAALELDRKLNNEDEDEESNTLESILDSGADWADVNSTKEGLRFELATLLKVFLTEKEYIVVTKSYGIGTEETCDENIGEELNVSAERVRQIKLAALHKLRKNIEVTTALKEYLG